MPTRSKSVYERFGQTANPSPGQIARSHTVLGPESIPYIAAREYRTGYDSKLWRRVAEYNGVLDLDDLEAGDVLAIPAPEVSET